MTNSNGFFKLFINGNIRPIFYLVALSLLAGCGSEPVDRHSWSIYKGDAESSSYSALQQVNRKNVGRLELAWMFRPNDAPDNARFARSECNPIVVDGVMYATSARHRLYAIDAGNGQQIWSFDPFDGGRGGGINRGVTYWSDGPDRRILFTAGDRLYAIDAGTGRPIPEFGDNGKVSMNTGMRGDPEKISIVPTSPGIIYDDLIIMGTEVSELYGAEPGYIRAFNVRTGEMEWVFHTIPRPGEFGYETWPEGAWKYAGGANNWAGMSLDRQRGLVFVSLGSPTYDFYGADRKGKNLFGNSVVALDAATGEYVWHFQTVHHDLWDYDLPAPPNLVTVRRDGDQIDAVAQTSKIGFLYLLDRQTGEPLFPVEERAVPASRVPGEQAWPTQPFPLKPAPYARQQFTEQDLARYSPESYEYLRKRFESLRYQGLFTPPDTGGTLMLPGTRGGSNWGGGAYDPRTGVLYVKSNDSPEIAHLKKVEAGGPAGQTPYAQGRSFYRSYCASCHGTDLEGDEPLTPSLTDLAERMSQQEVLEKIRIGGGEMPAFSSVLQGNEEAIIAYLFGQTNRELTRKEALLQEIRSNEEAQGSSRPADTLRRYLDVTAYGHFRDPQGRPSITPPWGTLNAINLNTGEYEWQVPVGNMPELQAEGAPPTGTGGSAGPIVTAGGLVFIGGTRDRKFRAYDKQTGELLWETQLPGVANATAATYMHDGRQFIAISVGGDKVAPGGYIYAFALP